MLTDGRTTDGRRTTDAGVTGILIAHLRAFGSGELKIMHITTHSNVNWFVFCCLNHNTVLPAKSDSDVMFCLQSNQGLRINRSLLY